MAASKKGGMVRSATTGRYVTTGTAAGRSGASAVETLRAARTARIANALKQANRKTGLLSPKK